MMLKATPFFQAWLRLGLVALLAGAFGLVSPGIGPTVARAEFSPQSWQLTTYGNAQGTIETGDNRITMRTNGANVWNAADEFSFLWQPVQSLYDECSVVTITTAVYSIANYENLNAAAGLMFRDSDAAAAKNVMWRVLPDGSTRFTSRLEDGGPSQNVSGPKLPFPVELKLVRQGDTFTAYYKQNGGWKLHAYVRIDMGTTTMAGIGAFSITANPIAAVFGDVDLLGEDNYTPPNEGYVDPEPVTDGLLLRERFEDGSAANGPETVINPVWRGIQYACVVQQADGNRAWERNGMNGVVYVGDKRWTDYEAGMDVTFDPNGSGGTGKNLAELIVRGRDTVYYGNFYYAAGFADGTKLVLEKAGPGSNGRLKEVAIGNYADGVTRRVRVAVLDNRIDVYLDGVLQIQYADATLPNLRGSVGIRTEESRVLLDNIVVTRIDDPLGGDYDNAVGGSFDKPAPGN